MGIGIRHFADAANKAVNETLRDGMWWCCAEYRYVEDGDDVYAEADFSRLGEAGYVEKYPPLKMTGLFLELAGLGGRREITREDWQDFIARWGVLGVGESSVGGGPGETFGRFVEEARQAHAALRLYEREKTLDHTELLELALLVQRHLTKHTRTQLYRAGTGWTLSWDFQNLLGAAWLQMAFLLTAPPGAVRRCAWCNHVIDFELPAEATENDLKGDERGQRKSYQPHSDRKYTTRSDKKYHDGCRQKAYYHRNKARKGH